MPVLEIENFRKKYPDYADLDDATLAGKLAAKYPDSYGDLPGKVQASAGQVKTPKEEPPSIVPETTAGRFIAGVGGGMVKLGEGAKQRTLELGELLGLVSPDTVRAYQDYLNEVQKIDRPLFETTAGKVGQAVGEAALTAPLPGGIAGGAVRRAGTAALAGAGVGALQPTAENESAGMNAALGAAGGATGSLGSSALSKAYNWALAPTKNAIQMLSEKYGVRTTLGETTGSKIAQKAETILEDVPVVGLRKFREKQNQEAREAARGFLAKYIYDPDALDTRQMNRDFAQALFENLQRQVKGLQYQDKVMKAPETMNAAYELVGRYPKLFKEFQDVKLEELIHSVGKETLQQQKGGGMKLRDVTFEDMWTLRQGLGDMIGQAKKKISQGDLNETQLSYLSQLYGAVNKDLDDWILRIKKPEIKLAMESANDAYKNYVVKFSLVEEAFAKATGEIGGREIFSPKAFSTSLKKMVREEKIGKYRLFQPGEIEEMSGLASILQAAKRGGQFMENPPTGYRWGPMVAGQGIGGAGYVGGGPAGAAAALGGTATLAGLVRYLTATESGKKLAMAASKVEPDSLVMKSIMEWAYRGAARMPAAAAAGE